MRGWGGEGGRAAVPLLAEAGRDRGGCAVGGAVQAGAAFSEKLLGAVASEAAPGPRAVRLACALPASASFRWRDEAAARFPLSPGRAGARSRGDAGARGPARLGSGRPAGSAGTGNVLTGDQRGSGLRLGVSPRTVTAPLGSLETDLKYGKVRAPAACVSRERSRTAEK